MTTKTKAEKEAIALKMRVIELEEMVQPFAQFEPQLGLAERRGVTVVDVGIKVARLRLLVDCASEIKGRSEEGGEGKNETDV